MLELVSVEVENFRSFAAAVFTPLGMGQGMTAINGPNGSGKSSLATHAVLWALYGVTPDGVPVKAMRKQGSSGEVSVTVRFRHQGQNIAVSRSLRGKNDTTVARIVVDDIEQTNVSARTAATWVARRLGVDAEGFSTAFVVKQKELDALVRARPAERRALIERLAGIEQMSMALSKAREASRLAQSRRELLGEEPPIGEIEASLQDAESRHAEAWAMADQKRDALSATRVDRQAAEDEYQHLSELTHRITATQGELDVLQGKEAHLTERLASLYEARREAEGLKQAKARLSECESLVDQLEGSIRQATPMLEEVARAHAEVERLESEVSALHRERTEIILTLKALEPVAARHAEDTEELSASEAILHEYMATEGALSSQCERIQRTLTLLQENHDSGSDTDCPMCREPLKAPESLKVILLRELDAAQLEYEKATNKKAVLSRSIAELRTKVTKGQEAKVQADSARERLENVSERLHVVQKELLSAEGLAEELAESAHAALLKQQDAEARIEEARNRRTEATRAVLRAEEAVEAYSSLGAVEANLAEVTSARDLAQSRLDGLVSERGDGSLEETQSKIDALRVRELELAEEENSARMAASLASRDVEDGQRKLEQARRTQESLRIAAREVEGSIALASALEEFRRDRVARLAPELAEIASDLLLQMTEGRFSSLELDEDFTPLVTEAATGLERPSAWLSGGEESAVALALRIAVGEVVAGQRGGLLVLDEVLTAQDQFRRNATMAALRGLRRQIVTINHVSEATDLVDLVANVVPNGGDGSLVEQAAPEPGHLPVTQLSEAFD